MPRILIASCEQEISSFNPVLGSYEDFRIERGDEVVEVNEGKGTTLRGAIDVLREAGADIVPTYAAFACSAGPLADEPFERIAKEFLEALKPHAGQVDGVYFSLHGSMASPGELDPEGYLLEESRKILGEDVPIVISLDLHGVLTAKMCRHINGISMYHTYPHVDFVETGERAARLLLSIVRGEVKPAIARVPIPAIVRGTELVTETGCFGEQVRHIRKLISGGSAIGGGFLICNPFTDVPELCSQAVVVTNDDEATAVREATKVAQDFWANRARMQTKLIGLEDAVREASRRKGPVEFTDAADAPSSGATGDSNAILAEMVRQNYPHSVLAPLTDAPAAKSAFQAGIGATFRARLGGSLDPRYTPLELDVTVEMLSDGKFFLESWGTPENGGPTAVLRSGEMTIIVTSRPVNLFDRALFLAHGRDPQRFHSIIVKSPHCQPQFFDDWCEVNLNVDAPGSTSANIRSLGHKIAHRPLYPLDLDATFDPKPEIYQR